jgi:hypothetical protein
MKILFMTLALFSLLACQGKNAEVLAPLEENNGPQSIEIKQLMESNERIQRDLAEDIIFRSARVEQSSKFRVFLIQTRRFLVILLNDPMNTKTLKKLESLLLTMDNFPVTVRDQSYITPYIDGLKALVKELYLVQGGEAENYAAKFSFSKENLNKLVIVKDETAAVPAQRQNEAGEYIGFDSFKKKNNGTSSVITPAFTLEMKDHFIRFQYLTRFYKPDARAEKMIKFFIGEDKENVSDIVWEDLNLEVAPDAATFSDAVVSKNIDLIFNDTKIRVKVEYKSDSEKGFFPAFNLYGFDIVEKK